MSEENQLSLFGQEDVKPPASKKRKEGKSKKLLKPVLEEKFTVFKEKATGLAKLIGEAESRIKLYDDKLGNLKYETLKSYGSVLKILFRGLNGGYYTIDEKENLRIIIDYIINSLSDEFAYEKEAMLAEYNITEKKVQAARKPIKTRMTEKVKQIFEESSGENESVEKEFPELLKLIDRELADGDGEKNKTKENDSYVIYENLIDYLLESDKIETEKFRKKSSERLIIFLDQILNDLDEEIEYIRYQYYGGIYERLSGDRENIEQELEECAEKIKEDFEKSGKLNMALGNRKFILQLINEMGNNDIRELLPL